MNEVGRIEPPKPSPEVRKIERREPKDKDEFKKVIEEITGKREKKKEKKFEKEKEETRILHNEEEEKEGGGLGGIVDEIA